MKKSLSLLLAFAMVFSMFASVALAADDDLTAQQKFDALKNAGIFRGINDAGDAGLDLNMNRAQFARVAALILGLEGIGDPDTKVVTEKPFSDVELGQWYTEEVAAVKEAGLMVGNGDGTFNPTGDITVQQLAVVTAGLLGIDAVEDAEVEGAADWAAGYIQALVAAGVAFPTNYTEPATRAQLVELSFQANAVINPEIPTNIGIASAAATDSSEITVTLNGPVDTAKASLTVKRGSVTQTVESTSWNSANTVATLKLASKLTDATYTVTFSGIDNLDESKATAEIVATAETVRSIEFKTASDTLPLADGVKVEFIALNQYGKQASFSSGSFTIAAGSFAPVNVSGEQAIRINIDGDGGDTGDKVPVTIIYTSSGAQANKIFTVGTAPIVSSIEVGDLKDADNETIESVTAGDVAYLEFKAYDQYGIEVTSQASLTGGTGVTVVVPDNDLSAAFVANVVGTDADDLELTADADASAKNVTVTLFANGTGQSVQKVIPIATPKVPATVEFGAFSGTIAVGDTNVKLSLVVKDADGATLTNKEIADNADKFTIYATGGVVTLSNPIILQTGTNKGKIQIATADRKGTGTIYVQLANDPNQKSTLNISVEDARVPERLAYNDTPANKLINGAESTISLDIYDQYGRDADEITNAALDLDTVDEYYVEVVVSKVSGTDGAAVLDASGLDVETVTGDVYALGHNDKFTIAVNKFHEADMIWKSHASAEGTYKLTATLYKENGVTDTEVTKFTNTVVVYSGKSANLTYTAAISGATDNTLLEVDDYINDATDDPFEATYADAGRLAKKVTVSAKEGSSTVALPNVITAVTSSNPSLVAVDNTGAGTYYLVGKGTGTATISVLFTTPNGTSTANLEVTVKDAAPVVQSIAADNGSKAVVSGDLAGLTPAVVFGDVNPKDQYGTTYDLVEFLPGAKYASLLNIRFFVADVDSSNNGSTVTANATTGVISVTGTASDISSFTLNAVAPNGQTVSTLVIVD